LVKNKNSELKSKLTNREEYISLLKIIKNKLHKLAYWDAQDIAQGGDKIHDYQEFGHMFIADVMLLIDDQLMYLKKQVNDYLLHYNYGNRNNDCEKSYVLYMEKRSLISI